MDASSAASSLNLILSGAKVMAASRRGKIHLRISDARMQLEKIFQQPHARDAVDGGQMERDFGPRLIRVIKECFRHRRVVEKGPFGGGGSGANARARRGIQLVKLLQPIFAQQAEHRLAAEAAERLAVQRKRAVRTWLAAMEAGGHAGSLATRSPRALLLNGRCHRRVHCEARLIPFLSANHFLLRLPDRMRRRAGFVLNLY